MALVAGGRKRSAPVESLEEVETFAVYVADFWRLRGEHPSVNQVLIGFLAEELDRQNDLLLEALYVPVERRVLRRLAELSALYAGRGSVIPLTQEQLAEMAGTSRATVNRVLREEEVRGTVELRRAKTAVLDSEAIARRAR
jgi:CRP/FNR family transcriptional regulator, cyclic AMP receptor protein